VKVLSAIKKFKKEMLKMAWTYKKDDIQEEVSVGGNYLDKSGCYEVTITKIEDTKTKNGASQLKIDVETKEKQKTTIFFVYSDKEGKEIEFKTRQLNHLCYLLKLTPDKLEQMNGKEIGMFMKAKLSQDGKYINFDVDGFYDAKTKLTAKELNEKKSTTPEIYNQFKEKYEKEEPLVKTAGATTTSKTEASKTVDTEDFPF
jgi:hypothetical protein